MISLLTGPPLSSSIRVLQKWLKNESKLLSNLNLSSSGICFIIASFYLKKSWLPLSFLSSSYVSSELLRRFVLIDWSAVAGLDPPGANLFLLGSYPSLPRMSSIALEGIELWLATSNLSSLITPSPTAPLYFASFSRKTLSCAKSLSCYISSYRLPDKMLSTCMLSLLLVTESIPDLELPPMLNCEGV